MNEKTMTLEELIQYAKEAKEKKEKEIERLEMTVKKEQECFKLIQCIIESLSDEEKAIVVQKDAGCICVTNTEHQVSNNITLDALNEVIEKIPYLASYWGNNMVSKYDSRALEVAFSRT